MPEKPIFSDASGKRATYVRGGLATFLLTVSLVGTAFMLSLVVTAPAALPSSPLLPSPIPSKPPIRSIEALRTELARHPVKPRVPLKSSSTICLAFYLPWEQSSLDSFNKYAGHLTHVSPAWLSLSDDLKLDTTDFDLESNIANNQVILTARKNGVRIVPLLSNARDGNFSSARAGKMLTSSESFQTAFLKNLAEWCVTNKFQGINFDIEQISPDEQDKYPYFLALATKLFRPLGLEVSADVEASTPTRLAERLADATDYIVLMAYDQHDESGDAGPISPLVWTDTLLDKFLQNIDENKVVLGIGSYAYDWLKDKDGGDSISYQEAMLAAKGYRDDEKAREVVQWDQESLNSFFTYQDDENREHEVWIADAPADYNQWQLGRERGLRGAALWAMGTEDPALWRFMDRLKLRSQVPPELLEGVKYGFEIDYVGQGEILNVMASPSDGKRSISVDPATGLIDDVEYESYATPYIVKKSGFVPGKVVLTFDDGPDPEYTDPILDILQKNHAPAVFFDVGSNVEAHPEEAQREAREGHEIGNHSFFHPNLGLVDTNRATLEIIATQRIIESTVGKSTILFRPPYNADSQPSTKEELKPVQLGSELGLITVGENVDPNDWNPTLFDPATKQSRPRTAKDIVDYTLSDLERRKGTSDEGNIILLHDAGGDRSQTVKALGPLIQALRSKGYQIVSLAQLLNKPEGSIMRPIPADELNRTRMNAVFFAVTHAVSVVLATGFLTAIALGALRVVTIIPLSLLHNRKRRAIAAVQGRGSVSVLIAAYNEEPVICDTIASVLESAYPITGIVVIDDGSSDKTSEAVAAKFADDPRVQVLRKENGGKASALNLGLQEAKGELVFCIDADTQLEPNAIGRLARHFEDPKVAAVAGNVQVGNIQNLVTAWQAVEYRTSQNMDRRAYAYLNAITVVPGAIGMWRKQAVLDAGGYETDTLAEDMDLTWRLRLAGGIIDTEPEALAFTEAPQSWGALRKQRFRWAFGTFQCLWKHRRAIFRNGWFGWFAIPNLWVFQVFFQLLAPLVDIQVVVALGFLLSALINPPSKELSAVSQLASLQHILLLYAIFFALELISGSIAYAQDKAKPWPLAWLFLQRFAYRQLMYVVMVQAVWRSLTGTRQSWGKLKRTGTVKVAGKN